MFLGQTFLVQGPCKLKHELGVLARKVDKMYQPYRDDETQMAKNELFTISKSLKYKELQLLHGFPYRAGSHEKRGSGDPPIPSTGPYRSGLEGRN
jgi:hypothetical protein